MTTNHIPQGLDVHSVRKRPAVVQSVLVTTDNLGLITEWILSNGHHAVLGADQLVIQTIEGPFTARPGDQVMRGLQGEFYRHEGGDFFTQAYEDLGPVDA